MRLRAGVSKPAHRASVSETSRHRQAVASWQRMQGLSKAGHDAGLPAMLFDGLPDAVGAAASDGRRWRKVGQICRWGWSC